MSRLKRIFDILENYQDHFNNDVMVAGKTDGKWQTYSTDRFIEKINNLSKGLVAKGIKKGDRIALMSGNRPEWCIIDFACNQLGVAIVPLYPTLSSHDLSHIVNDADVQFIFASSADLVEKVESALKENNLNLPIYTLDELPDHKHYSEIENLGKEQTLSLQGYRDQVDENDLLTLIYTSGTTGNPKGVFLTHKNIISNVSASNHLLTEEYKRALSFLPLCHIFERMVVYLYLSKGVQIYFSESLDNIVEDINDVKPDIFTTVPRVLEKVYDKVVAKGKELKGIKKSIFFWALDLGHRFQEPPKNGSFYNFKLRIARKLIFSKWKDALGGNIKLIISGGAALQERLARVFWAADIKVLEGYGLTETSPVIAVNSWLDSDVKFGTVGRVLSNLDVKIDEDGEILVKGPSIFPGYYKDEEATKDAIDEQGYLHTGDIGELTNDGFLKITDRKKEMFKTAGGKYVSPQILENKLMESLLIAQVMVVGENQRFPAALIVPAYDELEKWAKFKGISFSSREDLTQLPEVIEKYQKEVDFLNNEFGQWEKVKKFILLTHEWGIDSGELTPKLSLKRKVIMKKFEDTINDIYKEEK